MRYSFLAASALMLCAALVSGCGGKSTPAGEDRVPATPEQLEKLWAELLTLPIEQVNLEIARGIAADMSNRGTRNIEPILESLDVENPSDQTLHLVWMSLRPIMQPRFEESITRLTEPTHDSRTRRIAIDLLGLIETDTAKAKLLEIEKDDNFNIALAAYLARLDRADEATMGRFMSYWKNEKIHELSKQEMIRRLPDLSAPNVADALHETAQRVNWAEDVRKRAIELLGFFPSTSSVPVLEAAYESSPEPEMRQLAKDALEKVKASLEGKVQPGVEEGPGGLKRTTMPLELKSNGDGSAEIVSPEIDPASGAATAETPEEAPAPAPAAQ